MSPKFDAAILAVALLGIRQAGAQDTTPVEMEGDVWGPPEHHSHLVITCHRLRSKPIGEFDVAAAKHFSDAATPQWEYATTIQHWLAKRIRGFGASQ
jgi:hypothetical protein